MTDSTPPRRDRTNRGSGKLTLAQRRWLYGIVAALAPLAVATGVITEQMSPLLLALAIATLGGSGIALANPTKDDQ